MTTDPAPVPADHLLDRYKLWNEVVEPIEGWLDRGAAIRTMDLLEWQAQLGVAGPLLEIGVYAGKYFAILAQHACRAGTRAIGVDPFELVSMEVTWRCIAPAIAGDGKNIILQQGYSSDYDALKLLGMLGSYPRFISIDGSHDKEDVFYDLGLAEQLVAPGGIVAVDDFLNYVTPGVNEAVFAFYGVPRRLVPFAFIQNKLFLTFRRWSDRYRVLLEERLIADDVEDHSNFFRHRLQIDRALAEGRLWGSPMLLVP